MTEHEIRNLVESNYDKGFHCAESIVNAILEALSIRNISACKYASGFCGGIGKCKKDVCGALSGGIIALGEIYGRQNGGEDISELVKISTEFRQHFIHEFGSSVCEKVIEAIDRKGKMDCKDVTTFAANSLYRLLADKKIIHNELITTNT